MVPHYARHEKRFLAVGRNLFPIRDRYSALRTGGGGRGGGLIAAGRGAAALGDGTRRRRFALEGGELGFNVGVVIELAELGVERLVSHLDHRGGLRLGTPDLALHAVEIGGRVHRRERREGTRDLLLRASAASPGEHGVPLTHRRLVLGFKLAKLLLELADG